MGDFVLLVIDMQGFFYSALHTDTIKACRREIRRAVKNNCPIIFLEYANHGQTLGCLKDLVENYDRISTINKSGNDGSYEVVEELEFINRKFDKLRICGVNADVCVYETALGLRDFGKEIEIVADAVNASSGKADVMKSCRSLRKRGITIVKHKYYERIRNVRNG